MSGRKQQHTREHLNKKTVDLLRSWIEWRLRRMSPRSRSWPEIRFQRIAQGRTFRLVPVFTAGEDTSKPRSWEVEEMG
jgi:hypothetical protein